MTRADVIADGRSWTVAGLPPRARGDLHQAVVVARLRDAATGATIAGPMQVGTDVAGLAARVASGGFVGLVGVPSRVFPDLASAPQALDVVLDAPGYAARVVTVTVPAQPGFPHSFAGVDLGVLELHREPVEVRVATHELDPTDRIVPLPGAVVRVERSWARLDGLAAAGSAAPLLAISPGLARARAAGATLDLPALAMPAEPVRTLLASVPPGSTAVPVTAGGALAAGDLVALDIAVPDRAERLTVLAVHGPADPASPAVLELAHPTAHGHAEGSPARRIAAPAAPGPAAASLARPALTGDRTLVLAAAAAIGPGQVVRISGGAAAEYLVAGPYETTTGPDGTGHLPALSGLAAVQVSASSGALVAQSRLTLTQAPPAVDLTLT